MLVLSPASVASKWVEFEVEYFLRDRPLTEVIPLLNAPCNIPKILDGAEPLDFTDAAAFETTFATLVARLCPPAPGRGTHVGQGIAANDVRRGRERLADRRWDVSPRHDDSAQRVGDGDAAERGVTPSGQRPTRVLMSRYTGSKI